MGLREDAEKILKENKTCALATAKLDMFTEDSLVRQIAIPEVATIRYVSEGLAVYFETSANYKKYENLMRNNFAAIVITPHERTTLQMEGIVRELYDESAAYVRSRLMNIFGESPYFSHAQARFMQFETTWFKILRDSHFPPKYEEMKV
ncbi:MAG: pyridoxamine 5'-phosphate oxidase family protein [Nanoarchaeota archaeon]